MKKITSYPPFIYEIEALLSEREQLYKLAQANLSGVIVETGSYRAGVQFA